MKIAILGFDLEGRSSYEYLKARGHDLTILDRNPEVSVPPGVPAVLGDKYLDNLDRFEVVVRTAGLNPHKILLPNPDLKPKITTNINEFFKASPTKNIIGVTGTKGKGTTSTLIYRILQAAGKNTYLGGNIGLPPLDFIEDLKPDDWVVLELSSFQLMDLHYSPPIAVCLTVFPEHLDWHLDLNDYYHAKAELFASQTANDTAIYFADSKASKQIAAAGYGRKIPFFAVPGAEIKDGAVVISDQTICKTSDLKLLGPHNWQNVCAAVTAAWQVTQDVDVISSAVTSFGGLEHRLELIAELEGVRYYDDSYGTTPETAIAAIETFRAPEIVILGGSDKGIPFDDLAAAIANRDNVKSVITIGKTGPMIAELLIENSYQNVIKGGETMDDIVDQAYQIALPGDVVLLSPGCASFGMFKNYKDRGEQFTTAVQSRA